MKSVRRGAGLAVAAFALVCTAQPAGAQSAKRQFNIAAGNAASAVAEFARQADVNVIATGEQLAGLTLNEVRGSFTVPDALERLLAGKGHTVQMTPDGAFVIVALPPRPVSVPAPAYVAPPTVVLVPGFRNSVDQALGLKREAGGIVDAILAEDVARFPDANLAESLQRLPGVALTRGEGGEGRQITVRGLSPRYTRVRINGIEAAAASGASDINSSSNRTRAFDFSVFASELFTKLEVRKTSDAQTEEGSLGATVDLRTARPFDFKGRTVSAGLQGIWNSLARQAHPRASLLLSDRWDTPYGKVGALVSASYARRRATEEGYEAVEILAARADGGFCSPLGVAPQAPATNPLKGVDAGYCGFGVPRLADGAAYREVMGRTDDYRGTVANPAPGSGAFHPRLPRYRRSQTDYERSGLTGTVQWRSASGGEINLDTMLGRFANRRTDQYIAALSFGRTMAVANGKPQSSIVEAHFDRNGSWDYGKFNAVDVRSEALLDLYTTDFRQQVLSASQRISPRLKLHLLLGQSRSELDEPVRTAVSFDAPNVDGFSFDFRANRRVPLLDFGIDVADPANFSFGAPDADGTLHGQFTGRRLRIGNRLFTREISGVWELGDKLSLKGGYARHRNTWTNWENAADSPGIDLPGGVTVADVSRRVSGFGRGLGVAAPSSWVTVDLPRFLAARDIECHCDAVPGSQFQPLNQAERSVDERIDAFYGQFDFHHAAPGVIVRGNAGVRAVKTALTASALNSAGTVLVPVSVAHEYHDWLPALNLSAQLPSQLVLRYSAGRTLSRPEYLDLAPQATLTGQSQTVAIGNPGLQPVRARTQDLQLEWYYAPNAAVSLGYFHKRIGTFIQSVSERAVFSSLGLPDAMLTATGCSISGGTPACATQPDTEVVVNRKVNTPGGPLRGWEFNLQAPFSFLPGVARHLGLLANYTHIDSRITYITRADNPRTAANEQMTQVANFTGLSPRTHNLTLYYDDGKLGARISAASRSRYLSAVAGDVSGYDYTFVEGGTQIDLSLSYKLNARLRLRLDAQNLSDQPLRYGRDLQRNDTLLHVHFGRSLVFGLNGNY